MKTIKDRPRVDFKETDKTCQQHPAVAYCEEHYPVTCNEFQKILSEQYIMFCKKQKNYGPSNISVGTQLESADDVKLSLTGIWLRSHDKIQRLKQLVIFNQEDEVGESIDDTFQDLSIYGIISQIVKRQKWGK